MATKNTKDEGLEPFFFPSLGEGGITVYAKTHKEALQLALGNK